MQIELNKMNSMLITLKKKFSDYEENTLNLFNQLNILNLYWKDSNSTSFFENVFELEKETKLFICFLRQYFRIFNYIYNQYISIGNFIMYKKDNVTQIYNAIFEIKKVLNDSDNQVVYKLDEFKNSFTKKCNKIDIIETNINNSLNKIDIREVKSDLFSHKFKKLNVDKNVMEVNEVIIIGNKITVFRKEIDYLSSEIPLLLEQMKAIYDSSNSKKIEFFNNFFVSESKKICNYYNICETILLDQCNNYINASSEGIRVLNNFY